MREASIHVADGAIVAIGGEAPDTDRLDTTRAVIDAGGRLVTPGLIDAHFHANACGLDLLEIEASPASYVAAAARQRLERALRRGFTTVRDVAGGDLGMVRAIDEGLIDGPRYLLPGAPSPRPAATATLARATSACAAAAATSPRSSTASTTCDSWSVSDCAPGRT